MQGLTFTLYDIIAYFVPGTIVMWALAELANRTKLGTQQFITTLPDTVVAVAALVIIYAVGHALHAIANSTIDLLPFGGYPPRNYFPDQFEEDFQKPFRLILYRHIVRSFPQDAQPSDQSVALTDDREPVNETVKNAYWACYTAVVQSKPNSLVQIFGSICGLYRGLCVGSFLAAVVYLVGTFLFNDLALLIVVVVALGAGWLFLNRAARFKRYFTKTVYSDFLFIGNKPPADKEQSES